MLSLEGAKENFNVIPSNIKSSKISKRYNIRICTINSSLIFNRGFLIFFVIYFIQHCFICRPSNSNVCRRMLGSNPGRLRLWPWQSDALTSRLDVIHTRLDLIHTRLHVIHTRLDVFHTRLDVIHTRLDLIHTRLHPPLG